MAITTEFFLPPTGEDMDDVRLVAWVVEENDTFEEGTVLLEIETDKSVIEVPASQRGRLVKKLVNEGDMVSAAIPVARIEVDAVVDEGSSSESSPGKQPSEETGSVEQSQPIVSTSFASTPAALESRAIESPAPAGTRQFVTPAARFMASESGLDLASVVGTGPESRITLADVKAAASGRGGVVASMPPPAKGRQEKFVSTQFGDVYVQIAVPAAPRPLPPVVLIHGMFGDSASWAGVVHSLQKAGLTVCTIDLPGHGRSTARVSTIDQLLDSVAEALSLALSGPVLLVGHSLGGALAARIAAQPAALVTGLLLISPAGLGTEINHAFLNGTLHANNRAALVRELDKLAVNKMPISDALLDQMLGQFQANRECLADVCSSFSNHGAQQIDVIPHLDAITAPIVAIHGRSDQIIPWQHLLNLPPRAALHLVPQVGHTPHWEAAALVVERIVDLAIR